MIISRGYTLLVLFLELGASSLSAICPDSLDTRIHPLQPNTRDLVAFSMAEYGTCTAARDSFVVDRAARTVALHAELVECGEQGRSWKAEAQAGTLEAGQWTFVASVDGENCVQSEFEVTPAENRPAGDRPAASLLFPYFQVALDGGGEGMTTLFAIGNDSIEASLAHVVVWTDWGIPTLAFDVYLPAQAVRTVNLRDIFVLGNLPVSDPAGAFPGCASPIDLPALGSSALETLRKQHTGRPHPGDGLCYGSSRRAENIATGFVTVDLANRCSAGLEYPTSMHPDYFAADGSGLAASSNVLYGDYFYIDVEAAHAQGFEAVPLVADAELGLGEATFYTDGVDEFENRVPLPGAYRTRFLAGGAFDGYTSLVIWRWDPVLFGSEGDGGPRSCAEGETGSCLYLDFALFDESGEPLGGSSLPGGLVTGIYEIGGSEIPVEAPFGSLVLENRRVFGCDVIPAGFVLESAWATPLLSAEGGYSVGFRAIPVE